MVDVLLLSCLLEIFFKSINKSNVNIFEFSSNLKDTVHGLAKNYTRMLQHNIQYTERGVTIDALKKKDNLFKIHVQVTLRFSLHICIATLY